MQKMAKSSIVYTLTVEDMVAFNMYHVRHSPKIRKTQRQFLLKFSILMFTLAVLAALFLHKSLELAMGVGLFTIAWASAYLIYYQKFGYIAGVRKRLTRLSADDTASGLFGSHTFEVDEQGFSDKTSTARARSTWEDLVRIENVPDYTYIYTSADNAFVIPHKAITGGDFKAVLEQIGRHYQPDKPKAS